MVFTLHKKAKSRLLNWFDNACLWIWPSLWPQQPAQSARTGFTLAELLISLAILGVISTFTIPKVLQAQQDQKYNARAHETAAMITAAYKQAQLAGTVTANTSIGDLTQYFNYVSQPASIEVDGWSAYPGTETCTPGGYQTCLILQNGGILYYNNGSDQAFGGTAPTNAIWINYDPDSVAIDPTSGISFTLYYNGRVGTAANLAPGATSAYGGIPAGPDPPWFSW